MKHFFRRRSRPGAGGATEAAAAQSPPAETAQPAPLIAEAIPLEIQKRMLHNIRRNLHSQTAGNPR